MNYSVIITSAGSGKRANLGYNKLLYQINGKILLDYTVAKFNDAKEIIITASKEDFEFLTNYYKDDSKIKVIIGGDNREASVFEGVKNINNDIVLIHDGARVNVSRKIIEDVIDGVINLSSNVIPVIKDELDKSSRRIGTLVVQTPQGFRKKELVEAFEMCDKDNKFGDFRDDSSLVYHYLKNPISFVLGDINNFKVTFKEDLERMEKIL
ncbi:MAG: 2-C-methyl-D-erythritol 4-phosphate cytidylyltransferase [Bacilli bacterium]|nr:2-C-methyl-D-erythritol 4-phosphate cytidylyltransferase [Bacilli bacterium]